MAEAILVKRSGASAHTPKRNKETAARRVAVWRILLSLVLCFFPPLVAYHALKGGGPIAWILEYLATVEALFLYRYLRPRSTPGGGNENRPLLSKVLMVLDRVAPWLIGALLAGGAVVILIGLDITPASAFLAWFALVAEGSAGGTIAYMFVVMFAFFSAVFSGITLSADALFPIFGVSAVNLLLWGVILEDKGLSAVAAILFIVALIYFAGRRLGRIGGKSIMAVIQVTLVTAFIALPLSTVIIRNSLIDGLFSIHMDGTVAQLFPNFPFLYNVPGYGSSLSSTVLGERPNLTSRPVFQVTGPSGATIYLRTGVYDIYTGVGWRLSNYEKRRGELAAYFYGHGPTGPIPSSIGTITVKLLIDFYSSVPNTLNTVGFLYSGRPVADLSYGSLASGFVVGSPMSVGTIVTDVVDPSPPPPPEVAGLLNQPLEAFGGGGSPWNPPWDHGGRRSSHYIGSSSSDQAKRYNYWASDLPRWMREESAIPSRYSITPQEEEIDLSTGHLSREVVNLAHSLARPTESETIAAIRNYLVDNYRYSLNTTAAGPADDTVDAFLFHSKTGYCVHFATAFVILARLDGIPARYVTGFLVYLPQDGTTTTVTGLSAHAWAEVWVPKRGWVTEEATPPMLESAFSVPGFYHYFNPTDSSLTARELAAVLGNRVPVRERTLLAPAAPTGHRPAGSPLTGAGMGALGLAALALFAILLTRRLAPEEVRLARLVKRIMRRSRWGGLPDPERVGWSAWADALSLRKPARRGATHRASAIILRHYFGRQERPGEDLSFLERFYRSALRGLRARRKRGARAPQSEPIASSRN